MVERDEHGWMPIETAAKDGGTAKTSTYVWLSNGTSMRVGFWMSGEEFENHGSIGGGWRDLSMAESGFASDLRFKPTHWQPVPLLPSPTPERGDG